MEENSANTALEEEKNVERWIGNCSIGKGKKNDIGH